MSSEVNLQELAAMLRAKHGKKGLRAVAEEIGGVSASTLSRVEQGKLPDLDTFVRICRWLGEPPERFVYEPGELSIESKTPDIVAAHLHADRTLDPKTAEALVTMIRLAFDAMERGELPDRRGESIVQRGYKAAAERQAAKLRSEMRLPDETALIATEMAKHMRVGLIDPHKVPGLGLQHLEQLLTTDPDSWSALTLGSSKGTVIIYNPHHSVWRQESDITHELAHLLRDHKPSLLVPLPGLPLVLRTYDHEQEEEADWLGACLKLRAPPDYYGQCDGRWIPKQ